MRPVILHGHIFKNAGTTFDWSLRQNFGNGFLDHRDDQQMLEDGRGLLAQLITGDPALCAISSHHMTGDLPDLPGVTLLPVFFLRHPLARMRSVYDFERQQVAETPGARAAKEKGFRDYVAWRMRPDVRRTVRNYQTMYLAGRRDFCTDREMAETCFGLALEVLAGAAGVGIVEHYDESMVVLEDRLGYAYPDLDLSYEVQNTAAAPAAASDLDSAVDKILAELGPLARQVIDANSLDLALYQVACESLQARSEQIDDFQGRLAAFRSRRPQR